MKYPRMTRIHRWLITPHSRAHPLWFRSTRAFSDPELAHTYRYKLYQCKYVVIIGPLRLFIFSSTLVQPPSTSIFLSVSAPHSIHLYWTIFIYSRILLYILPLAGTVSEFSYDITACCVPQVIRKKLDASLQHPLRSLTCRYYLDTTFIYVIEGCVLVMSTKFGVDRISFEIRSGGSKIWISNLARVETLTASKVVKMTIIFNYYCMYQKLSSSTIWHPSLKSKAFGPRKLQ